MNLKNIHKITLGRMVNQNQVLKSYNLRVTQKIEMMDSQQTYKCHAHFLT
jgi:hypothetical protein